MVSNDSSDVKYCARFERTDKVHKKQRIFLIKVDCTFIRIETDICSERIFEYYFQFIRF